jgi:hypothetical protein
LICAQLFAQLLEKLSTFMAAAQLSAQLSGKLSKSMAGAQSRVQFPKIGSPNPIRNQTTRTSHKEVSLPIHPTLLFPT